MFSEISEGDKFDFVDLNSFKNIYINFFENVNVTFLDEILIINVKEFPIVESLTIKGIKAKKLKKAIENLSLKEKNHLIKT